MPFWFSLAVHGTEAYAEAVERTLEVTRQGAEEIRGRAELELVAEPELSILAFRRHGWADEDHHRWAAGLREAGTAFVFPTSVRGRDRRAARAREPADHGGGPAGRAGHHARR